MLYHLIRDFDLFDFPGERLFSYISFRSGMAFIIALLLASVFGRRIIERLQKMQVGEIVRDLGLEGQMSKKGTPTMGGVIIIIAIMVPCLLLCDLTNHYVLLMLVSTLLLGGIGFVDDYIKVVKKDKEGLPGRFKIVGQVLVGLLVGLTMYLSPQVVIRQNSEVLLDNQVAGVTYAKEDVHSTATTIPFVKNNNFDYKSLVSYMGENIEFWSAVVFILIAIFIVTAVSNGANLTDGLDGLATGTSSIIGVTLGILAYLSSRVDYASYLNIMYIPGTQEMVIYASAFIGATIGFLWYNSYPAQVFMGDTGSLMLGGVIAVFAIIIRKELLIPILCGVFLVENLSVMMQVSYFKFTKRKYGEGRRLFKMAPLHHHFQKAGNSGIQAIIQKPFKPFPESKIVIRFWIVSLLLAVLTIVTLKLR